MYAVFAHGGKQFRAVPGEHLRLERIASEPGDSIELSDVLLVADGDVVQLGEGARSRRVVGTVVAHRKAPKVIVFKKKRRKQYRRTRGHRQHFTEVRIDRID